MRKSNLAPAAEPASDLRQRAARARDAAGRFIKRPAPAEPPAGDPDPALAAIEAHRSAFEEYERLAAVANDLPSADPGYRTATLAAEELGRREIAAYEALLGTKPTTLAGAASLATYMCDAVRTAQIDDKPSDGQRALRTIADALQRLDPAAEQPNHPDAALFALGADFMAAWAVEDAPDSADAEYLACTGLAEQIVRLPADTVAGLGIKALLLARLDSEDSGPRRPVAAQGPLASHWNVLRQIQEGAARLAAGQAASATPSASVKPDLSALTVVELARLYPVLVRAEVALGSAGESPCFLQNNRTERTNAGRIINWEVDRLQRFSSAVAAEISRRQPVNRGDQAERANTLLTHLVLTGGVEEHPEVLSEICAAWGSAR